MAEIYIFARLEPKPGVEGRVRDEVKLVLGPTRAEPGCIRIEAYESLGGPAVFYIHSVWRDAAAFEEHVTLPHTVRFVEGVSGILMQPLAAARTRVME